MVSIPMGSVTSTSALKSVCVEMVWVFFSVICSGLIPKVISL
ncbi:uncharacterized protein METZ01_LOCUS105171, partial [marine metagenome]